MSEVVENFYHLKKYLSSMKKKSKTGKAKSSETIRVKAGWLKGKANLLEELMKEKAREKKL